MTDEEATKRMWDDIAERRAEWESMTRPQILRALAARGQYGQKRTPRSYYISDYYVSFSEACRSTEGAIDFSRDWPRIVALSRRYHKFVNYMTEIEPEWKDVEGSTVYYADNSIEHMQRDKYGNERRVMDVAPHGDLC